MTTPAKALVRPLIVALLLVAWFAVAGAGGPTVGKLSEVQESDQGAFLPASAESSQAAQLAPSFADQTTVPALFVVDGASGEADLRAVAAFAESIDAAELVDDPHERVLADVLGRDIAVVPAADDSAVVVIVPLKQEDFLEPLGETSLATIVAETLNAQWKAADLSLDGYVSGPVGLIADIVAAFAGIDGLLLLVALSAVLVILLLVYRSPILPFLVLTTSLTALAATVVVVYTLAHNDLVVLNGQSQGIMFILVVGATTDYALLLVSRYREELRRHEETYQAMKIAWRRSLEPIAASAITVIAGLLTLLFSDLKSNSSLGPVAAIGIVMALVSALTFLPALLLIGGKRARGVYWPASPRFTGETSADLAEVSAVERASGIWGKISAGVARHPRRTWVAALAGLLAASAFVPMLNVGGVGQQDVFMVEVDSVRGLEVLERSFEAGATSPIEVYAPAEQTDDAVVALDSIAGVDSVEAVTASMSQGAPAGAVPDEPALEVDGWVKLQLVTDAAGTSKEATDVVADVRKALADAGIDALVGGDAAQSLDTRLTTARDLMFIVPTILLVIFVVLIMLLRAVVAPAIIMVANVASFTAALGVSTVLFTWVFGFDAIDPAVVLFGFVFLVALGVDYSIFLMSRVREESLLHGTREGVRRGLAVTGGVITSAGVVLAATFAALVVLPLTFLFQLALLVAIGVLIDTFVVRTLLVPGAVYDLGRPAWWPWHRTIGT